MANGVPEEDLNNLFWIFPFSWCSDKSISLGLFEGFGAVKSIRVLEEFENDFGDFVTTSL